MLPREHRLKKEMEIKKLFQKGKGVFDELVGFDVQFGGQIFHDDGSLELQRLQLARLNGDWRSHRLWCGDGRGAGLKLLRWSRVRFHGRHRRLRRR